MPQKVMFWLLPQEAARRELAVVIEQLRWVGTGTRRAALHPPFEPHVSLASGEIADGFDLEQMLNTVVNTARPLTLSSKRRLGCPDPGENLWSLWRSMTLDFEPSMALDELARSVRGAAGVGDATRGITRPHMSLQYSLLTNERKQEMLDRLDGAPVPERFPQVVFDSIQAITAAQDRSGLEVIRTWERVAEVRLT